MSAVDGEYQCSDDMMRSVLGALLKLENRFKASKGDGVDIIGAHLRLVNPRARLSRSEMRGKVFSALGELFWCLSGSNELRFIEYYIKEYVKSSDDNRTVHGAYGPRFMGRRRLGPGRWLARLLGRREENQVKSVLDLLRRKPGSRRAVLQIFDADDLRREYKDVPCTCTIQAIVRQGRLNFVVYMRSNDAYLGLPHDIFLFTMLQELMARSLEVDLGVYHHMVGNIHLYDEHRDSAQAYVDEDFQSIVPMPAMPPGDPFRVLPALLEAEKRIRANPRAQLNHTFDAYWQDVIRLLRVYGERRSRLHDSESSISLLRDGMVHKGYAVYL